uniref:Transmembrane protein C6orf70-like protein n=1 Tax=Magallana gigas TaxID=29159 RepID=K1RPB6_MAGGI
MECLQLKTCLSRKVHFLIVEAGRSRKKMEEGVSSCLTSEGFIHWEQARCYLSEMTITDGYDYFLSCVESLSPVFFEVEEHLLSKQQKEIWMKHKIYLEWIPEPHLSAVEDSLNFLNSPNPSHHILALQLMSSILERTLGDVFENESSSQCPSLLKDILNSGEINKVFGKHVVQILRALMGPPTSLNLRNVVWHGFPNIGEIPRRYGCFLYLTLPSLGKILDEKRKGIQTHRQLMKLSLNVENTCDIPDLIPQIPLVKELIEVTQPFHSRQALLQCSLELMAERRYSYAVALLLPQLEHILRLMFVSVNNCSERVLTAEDLLFDLMIYPEGPRVRDKVSHGEANLQDIPESLALAVLVAVVMVMWKCSKFTTSNENELIKDLAIFESQYCSAFHPMSIIKQKIVQILDIVAKLPDAMQYDETLSLKVLSPTFELCKEDREMFEEIQSVTEDLVLFICQDWDIQLTPKEINKW